MRLHSDRLHIVLTLLFALVITYRLTYTVSAVELLEHRTSRAAYSVRVNPAAEVIQASGLARNLLRRGDVVLAVNGRRLSGLGMFRDAFESGRPGQALILTVLPAGSTSGTRTVAMHLEPQDTHPPTFEDWVLATLFLGMPFFCLLLGFYVAAVRPRDP